MRVAVLNKLIDLRHQIFHTSERPPADRLQGYPVEPDFNLVPPRREYWGEVDVNAALKVIFFHRFESSLLLHLLRCFPDRLAVVFGCIPSN